MVGLLIVNSLLLALSSIVCLIVVYFKMSFSFRCVNMIRSLVCLLYQACNSVHVDLIFTQF